MNSPMPGWLDALKQRHPSQPHATPSSPPHPEPRPGQIRRLLPVDLAGRPALVLVIDSDYGRQAHTVVLLSPDTGFGSDRDLLLLPEDSGLPYDVIVQTEVFGYAWTTQLDAVHGDAEASLPTVHSLLTSEPDRPEPDLRAGPPVVEATDPRWQFKLTELARLQALTGECSEQLVDGERHLLPDPVALRPPAVGEDPLPSLEYILALTEGVQDGTVTFPAWLVDLILADDTLERGYRDAQQFDAYQALIRLLETWLAGLDTEHVPIDVHWGNADMSLEIVTHHLLSDEHRHGRTSVELLCRDQDAPRGPIADRVAIGDGFIQCVRTPCHA